MDIDKRQFFQLFGDGVPTSDADLEAMDYGGADDRRALLALARCQAPKTVVEFGVQTGLTARLLLDEIPTIETYIGIDLPRAKAEQPVLEGQAPEKPKVAGALVKDDERVKIIRKRSEQLTAADLPAADLVYIDGGHDRETVLADTKLAREILAPGGVIVWHDYGNDTVEVTGAIYDLNRAEGNHICRVGNTWVCFEMNRGEG